MHCQITVCFVPALRFTFGVGDSGKSHQMQRTRGHFCARSLELHLTLRRSRLGQAQVIGRYFSRLNEQPDGISGSKRIGDRALLNAEESL
jgi:hypothetical protein